MMFSYLYWWFKIFLLSIAIRVVIIQFIEVSIRNDHVLTITKSCVAGIFYH